MQFLVKSLLIDSVYLEGEDSESLAKLHEYVESKPHLNLASYLHQYDSTFREFVLRDHNPPESGMASTTSSVHSFQNRLRSLQVRASSAATSRTTSPCAPPTGDSRLGFLQARLHSPIGDNLENLSPPPISKPLLDCDLNEGLSKVQRETFEVQAAPAPENASLVDIRARIARLRNRGKQH